MFDEEDVEAIVERLISSGLIEVVGIDSVSGEFLYQVSPLLNALYPEIKGHMDEDFLRQVNSLWAKGFVSMDVTSANPTVSLNKLAFNEKAVASLATEERNALFLMMKAMQ